MTLSKEEVLIATFTINSDDPPVIFRIGDVLKVQTNEWLTPVTNMVTGRLKRVDDDEIELDISERFLSKLVHISFENIAWITKVSQDD